MSTSARGDSGHGPLPTGRVESKFMHLVDTHDPEREVFTAPQQAAIWQVSAHYNCKVAHHSTIGVLRLSAAMLVTQIFENAKLPTDHGRIDVGGIRCGRCSTARSFSRQRLAVGRLCVVVCHGCTVA